MIATGIGGLNGPATVAVWTYAEKGTQSMVTLVKMRRLIPTVSPPEPSLGPPCHLIPATTGTNLGPNLDEYWIVIPLLGVVDPLTHRRKWLRTVPQFLMMNLRYYTEAYFGVSFLCRSVVCTHSLDNPKKKNTIQGISV